MILSHLEQIWVVRRVSEMGAGSPGSRMSRWSGLLGKGVLRRGGRENCVFLGGRQKWKKHLVVMMGQAPA